MNKYFFSIALALSLTGCVSTNSEDAQSCALKESVINLKDSDSKLSLIVKPNINNEVKFEVTLLDPNLNEGETNDYTIKISANGDILPLDFKAKNKTKELLTWQKKGSSCALKGESVQVIWRKKTSETVKF